MEKAGELFWGWGEAVIENSVISCVSFLAKMF